MMNNAGLCLVLFVNHTFFRMYCCIISQPHSLCANAAGFGIFPGFFNFSSDVPKYCSLGGGVFLESV